MISTMGFISRALLRRLSFTTMRTIRITQTQPGRKKPTRKQLRSSLSRWTALKPIFPPMLPPTILAPLLPKPMCAFTLLLFASTLSTFSTLSVTYGTSVLGIPRYISGSESSTGMKKLLARPPNSSISRSITQRAIPRSIHS